MKRKTSKSQHTPLKRIFFTGILVTVPTSLTLFLFYWLADMIDRLGATLISYAIPNLELARWVGIFTTVVIIFTVGLITSNWFGNKLYKVYETVLNRIPGINRVFHLFKKVLEMILEPDRSVFKHPVLLEFPRKDLWIIGFLSAPATAEFNEKTGRDLVSVFIPTTPNPTSGVLALVPREDLIMLDMSIEEASKIIISGGILTPESAAEVNRASQSEEANETQSD